jgi:hypothetical protein
VLTQTIKNYIMKTMKLFLTFALIGIFQIASAQTDVHATGTLTNTNGAAINVWLTLYSSNGNTTSATAVTNSNGYYSHIFTTFAGDSGAVFMHVDDCNGDSITEWKSYELLTGDTLANFTTFNYCPNTVPTTCNAYFDIAQAAGPNGNLLPGSLVVMDSSTSSNPAAVLTYTWDFGDNTTGTGNVLTHTYTGNGPYLLCLTIDDGLGCTDTYCDTVSVDSLGMIESEGFTLYIGGEPALGLDNPTTSTKVNVYPNPATDFLNIEFNAGNKALNSIVMFDLSGKTVYENSNVTDNLTTISTTNIEPGTYLIRMLFDSEVRTQKVIVK